MSNPALTQLSPAGGCGCKMPQQALSTVLSSIRAPFAATPAGALRGGLADALRVGLEEPDDAAVFDLDGLSGQSLVLTCDFQTPVVDDAADWGRIAAANALSDVYAMGGRPVLALNLLCWPEDLDQTLMGEVLAGGAEIVSAAGAVLAGGHSIVDPVPKYGLAVVGAVPAEHVLLKGGARAGDRLILTKPLGVGVVGTAIKRGLATADQVREATAVMTRLNASASSVAVGAGLRGATDVTGFGLLGHLHEMALAAGLTAQVCPPRVPRLASSTELIETGCAPDGARRTLAGAVEQGWFRPNGLPRSDQLLLADPQTSGGLLLAAPPDIAEQLVDTLRAQGDQPTVDIGEFRTGEPGAVSVRDYPGGH